jgi:hypothetical protein
MIKKERLGSNVDRKVHISKIKVRRALAPEKRK